MCSLVKFSKSKIRFVKHAQLREKFEIIKISDLWNFNTTRSRKHLNTSSNTIFTSDSNPACELPRLQKKKNNSSRDYNNLRGTASLRVINYFQTIIPREVNNSVICKTMRYYAGISTSSQTITFRNEHNN